MKITFETLLGDGTMNNFMHAGDVFEPGKQLAEIKILTLTVEEPTNVLKILETLWEGFKANQINGVFCAISAIDEVSNTEYPIFFKEGVQTISNGSTYCLFKDLLQHMGYDCETDQYMHVTSIKYK